MLMLRPLGKIPVGCTLAAEGITGLQRNTALASLVQLTFRLTHWQQSLGEAHPQVSLFLNAAGGFVSRKASLLMLILILLLK